MNISKCCLNEVFWFILKIPYGLGAEGCRNMVYLATLKSINNLIILRVHKTF